MCHYLNVLKVFHLVCIKFLLPNIFTLFLRLEKNDLICSITQTKNIIFTMYCMHMSIISYMPYRLYILTLKMIYINST